MSISETLSYMNLLATSTASATCTYPTSSNWMSDPGYPVTSSFSENTGACILSTAGNNTAILSACCATNNLHIAPEDCWAYCVVGSEADETRLQNTCLASADGTTGYHNCFFREQLQTSGASATRQYGEGEGKPIRTWMLAAVVALGLAGVDGIRS